MPTTTAPDRSSRRADPARRLRDVLRPALLTGAYGSTPLPDEGALAVAHGVSRNTVREALDLLRQEGLVERRRGSGTFSVSQTATNRLSGLLGLSEYTPTETGVDNDVVLAEIGAAQPLVAARLEIAPGADVVALERVRRVGDEVVSLDTSYLPAHLAGDLLRQDLDHGDLFAVLEQRLGLDLGTAEVVVEAFSADRAHGSSARHRHREPGAGGRSARPPAKRSADRAGVRPVPAGPRRPDMHCVSEPGRAPMSESTIPTRRAAVTAPARDEQAAPAVVPGAASRPTWARVARLGGGARPLLSIVLAVLVWEVTYRMQLFSASVLPSPADVVLAAGAMADDGTLWTDLYWSARRAVLGFALGSTIGVGAGLLTARSRIASALLEGTLQTIRPIPAIALVPLAIMWFGLGEESKLFLVTVGVFFPVWITAHSGIGNTRADYLRVAACMGASRYLTLTRVVLPGALPYILAGLRVGIATAFILIVASEMTGATAGLGFRLDQARLFSQADRLFVCLVLLGLLGAAVDQLFHRVTAPLARWTRDQA